MAEISWRAPAPAYPAEKRVELPPLPFIKPVLGTPRSRTDAKHALAQSLTTRAVLVPRPPPQQPGEAALAELSHSLRRLAEGEPAELDALARLADGGDAAAEGCLRAARALEQLCREAEPGAPSGLPEPSARRDAERSQELQVQISFLETKVGKLRDKLHKRQDGQAKADEDGRRVAMVAEVRRLRAEVTALSPPPDELQELRRSAAEAKGRTAELRAEKEAAEAKEAVARRLVSSVESRLQDTVQARETEQAQLLEARRQLRQALEEQAPRIAAMELQRERRREVEEMRAQLARREADLQEELRQKLQREQEAAQRIASENKAATHIQAVHRGNEERRRLSAAREAERLYGASGEAYGELCQRELEELRRLEGELMARHQELDAEAADTRRKAGELEEAIRRIDQEAAQSLRRLDSEHRYDLETLELQTQSTLESVRMSEEQQQEQLEEISRAASAKRERHDVELQAVRKDHARRALELGVDSTAAGSARQQALEDAEHVRRATELAGTVWLVVRRVTFNREAMFAALSDALEVPVGRLRVIDPDAPLEAEPPQREPPAVCAGSEAAAAPQPALPAQPVAPAAAVAPLKTTRRGPARVGGRGAGRGAGRGGDKEAEDDDADDGPSIVPAGRQEATSWADAPLGTVGAASNRSSTDTVRLLGEALVPTNAQGLQAVTWSSSKPEKLDPSLRCVLFQIVEGDLSGETRLEAALRLADLVGRGHPQLEHLAIVRVVVARGELSLPRSWPEEATCVAERASHVLRGWQLVVSAYVARDPLVLKIAAFDGGGTGSEFLLHLRAEDLEALAAGASSLRPAEAVKAVLPSLRVVSRDGRLLLAAAQQTEAPPTVANEVVPLLSELGRLSAEHRRARRVLVYEKSQQRRAPRLAPPVKPPPKAAPPTLVDAAASSVVSTEAWEVVWEQVLEVSSQFVLLWVERGARKVEGRELRLTLQEAGQCEPFRVLLVAQDAERRHRVFSQLCQFSGLSLMVAVEEATSPAVVAVRVAPASSSGSRSEAAVLCFEPPSWQAVDKSVLQRISQQSRSTLLNFLRELPAAARAAVEGPGVREMARNGQVCPLGCGRQGLQAKKDGLTCVLGPAPLWAAASGAIGPREPIPAWRLLAQGGRRLSTLSGSCLHVVRVLHRKDPYSRFLVIAYEVGRGREWRLFVAQEDVQAALSVDAGATPSALAEQLLRGCSLGEAEGFTVLTLSKAKTKSNLQVLHSPESSCFGEQAALLQGDDDIVPVDASGAAAIQVYGSAPQAVVALDTPATGGRVIELADEDQEDLRGRRSLQAAVRRYSKIDLVITMEELARGRGVALSAYHALTCTTFEVAMGSESCACPERFCLERVNLCGVPLVFAVVESAFPHSLQAIVSGPPGFREFRCTVKDEGLFSMLPASQRRLFSICAKELLQFGAVGEGGSGLEGVVEVSGPDLGEVSAGATNLLRVPLDDFGCMGPPAAVMSIFQARLTIGGERFCLSLTKVCESGPTSFVFVVGPEGSSQARAVRLLWRGYAEIGQWPVSLYGEVVDLSGSNVLALVMLDPASVRVALVDAASKEMFQLVVLNVHGEETADGGLFPSDLIQCAREDVLRLYMTSAFVPVDVWSAEQAAAQTATGLGPCTGGATKGSASCAVLSRASRKLPSGQTALLTVIRELVFDGSMRCIVQMHHALSGKESKVTIPDAMLDEVLGCCSLGDCRTVGATAVDANRFLIGKQILQYVSVNSDGTKVEVAEASPRYD